MISKEQILKIINSYVGIALEKSILEEINKLPVYPNDKELAEYINEDNINRAEFMINKDTELLKECYEVINPHYTRVINKLKERLGIE